MKSRRGQCVHPRYGERGSVLGRFAAACSQARRALNSKGFAVIKKGSAVYKKAKELYDKYLSTRERTRSRLQRPVEEGKKVRHTMV